MAWVYLLLGSITEVAWIMILKVNNGFTKLIPSIVAIACILIGPYFMSIAIKTISVGTSYAIWVGINSVIMAILRVYYFNEPLSFAKIACVCLIVAGAIGLKLFETGLVKS